jgi:hypothetical protein
MVEEGVQHNLSACASAASRIVDNLILQFCVVYPVFGNGFLTGGTAHGHGPGMKKKEVFEWMSGRKGFTGIRLSE